MAKKKLILPKTFMTSLTEMLSEPDKTGREVHRRNYLIQILTHFGLPEPLNDVTQKKKRPDLRFYTSRKGVTENTPCPFVVETKDIGQIPTYESLPFRQMLKYVHTNRTRIVALAATDFRNWYQFEFDGPAPLYHELVRISAAAIGTDAAWKLVGGEEKAQEVFRPFLVGSAFNFESLLKQPSTTQYEKLKRLLLPELLQRHPPLIKIRPSGERSITQTDATHLANTLGTLMAPLVEDAIKIVKEAEPRTKIYSRFRLWLKQMTYVSGDLDEFLSKDRNPEEEQAFSSYQAQFAWLATYSLMNILYFLKGLEDRDLIPPIIRTDETLKNPSSVFSSIWHWLDSQGAKFASDFIRIQKIYCDWLIPRLHKNQLDELVRQVVSVSLIELGKADLLGTLYEQLMQTLDRDSRKSLGQYYTPRPIAEVLWQVTWTHLSKLGIPAEELTTLDPGCGSGMLLCRGVELLIEEMDSDTKKLGQTIRDLASRSINGFEINPLSAAIARINLYFTYLDAIKSRGVDANSVFSQKVPVTDIPVFNTDAYRLSENITDDLLKHAEIEGEDIEAWRRDVAFLQRTKNREDFILTIGNPPYCGQDQAVADGRADHLKVWKDEPCQRQPNSGVRESFLHYMGLGHLILSRGQRGMLALVTSDTWLNNHDYEIARRFFFRRYDPIGVLFMGSSMFKDAKVSTCLVWLNFRKEIRSAEEIKDLEVPVATLSVDSDPDIRFSELEQILAGKRKIEWSMVKVDEFACVRMRKDSDLIPTRPTVEITKLFQKTFPACETGADPFLTCATEAALRTRMKALLGTDDKVEPDPEISGKGMSKKLTKLRKIRDRENLQYKSGAVKNYYRFFGKVDTYAVPRSRWHKLYFEPALLHRSIIQTIKKKEWNPHEEGIRLAFNAHEVPIRCLVVPPDYYLHRWQHMRFAPLKIARISKDKKSLERTSNLTESGKELRSVFDSDEQFLFYVSGCVNSGLVQKGFASRAKVSTSPIPLIAPTDENLASKARSVAETTKDLASLEEFADEWRIGGKKGSSDPIKFSRIINDLCEKHDIEKQTISQVTAHLIWKTLIEKNETEVAYLYGVEIPTDLRSKKGITQESAERLEDTTKELGSSSQK